MYGEKITKINFNMKKSAFWLSYFNEKKIILNSFGTTESEEFCFPGFSAGITIDLLKTKTL